MSLVTIATQQRMTALAYPCELPEQCAHSRYRAVVMPQRDVPCSVVLTVNVGEE